MSLAGWISGTQGVYIFVKDKILRVKNIAIAHMLLGVCTGDCATNPNRRRDRFAVMLPGLR